MTDGEFKEFKYNGRTYVAIKNEGLPCKDCLFFFLYDEQADSLSILDCGKLQRDGKIPPCNAQQRNDGVDVCFVEKVES